MTITYNPITLSDLTTAVVEGTGVFDVLMKATKAHLEQEFRQGRIKGSEYATVYLGSLQTVLQTALQYTLQKETQNLDAQLKIKEIELSDKKIELVGKEVAIAEAKLINIPKEGALLDAQAAVQVQQKLNMVSECLRTDAQTSQILKEVELADKKILQADQEIALTTQKIALATEEVSVARAKLENIPKEGALLDAQASKVLKDVSLADKQILLAAEEIEVAKAKLANIPKEGVLLDAQAEVQVQQKLNMVTEALRINAQTALITQQADNALIEKTVLVAQECKLKADYDKTVAETGMVTDLRYKTAAETALLGQKKITETHQSSIAVNHAALLLAQAAAFEKDHEVKMQDLRVKAWATARTTAPDDVGVMTPF